MKPLTPGLLALLALLNLPAIRAAEPAPELGALGTLLLEERFDGATLPAGWTRNTGVLAVRDGVLRAGERAADKHLGAFRKALPLQDALVRLDFTLEGARAFHLGFDPAPGQLKKQGHLFSVMITATGWSITEHNNKSDPASKNTVRARASTPFERGRTYTLELEMKGEQVIARVTGKEPLRAQAPDFRVRKPGLVFRVGGADGQEVVVDNVRVWQLR